VAGGQITKGTHAFTLPTCDKEEQDSGTGTTGTPMIETIKENELEY
jgi:hypothetical protein